MARALESAAAEHAARMTAMENASKNATELIEQLTLTMNKGQASYDYERDFGDRLGRRGDPIVRSLLASERWGTRQEKRSRS